MRKCKINMRCRPYVSRRMVVSFCTTNTWYIVIENDKGTKVVYIMTYLTSGVYSSWKKKLIYANDVQIV